MKPFDSAHGLKWTWHLLTGVMGTFLLVLFLSQQKEMKHHIKNLEGQLQSTEEELTQLKSESRIQNHSLSQIQDSLTQTAGAIDQLQKSERTRVSDLEKTMARRMDNLADEFSRDTEKYRTLSQQVDSLRQSVVRDLDVLSKDILYPSVKVTYKSSVGGGTILYSHLTSAKQATTYVLTAYHVVNKAVETKDKEEIRRPIEVQTYAPESGLAKTYSARIVLYDEKKDLTILKFVHDRVFPYTARTLPKDDAHRIRIFTPLYAVGCPLGHDPIPTPGEVTNLNKQVGGERFFMMNAPTIFGNSGGGIFHRDTHELLGVSAMVCTYENLLSTPVPHLGIFISMDTITDWLDAEDMQFLTDPKVTPEACEEQRHKRDQDKPDLVRVTWENQ